MDDRRFEAKEDEEPTLEPPDLSHSPNEEMEQAENAEQGRLAQRTKRRTRKMVVRRKR